MLDSREISAAELADEYLARIDKYDKNIQSYITVTKEKAHSDAEKAQKAIDEGNALPLCGIPMAIKDNICTSICLLNLLKRKLRTAITTPFHSLSLFFPGFCDNLHLLRHHES